MLTVSALYVYPVKSLGGISLESAMVTDRGLEHDRRWMLVDEQNRFLTQRELPQMALLRVQLQGDGLLVQHKHTGESFLVPFVPAGEACTVTVWEDVCEAQYVGENADVWFSRMLSLSCRLVYMPENSQRKVDPDYAHGEEITSFSDGFPLLLIGQASLDNLNSRLSHTLSMERFRPNIVFIGGTPFQEDEMRVFNIAGITFYGVKPCARCVITTIDMATGEKGKEPLKTLSKYRQRGNKIYFGQNLLIVPAVKASSISVGDTIILL
ncbi:MOSC N-terminal beta barrel domain-containing protein [Flavitalea sp. BT771]|uniref:MOSC domain-containing protein n=1 Tax=Flavitalea sp. BT771 TaxID=3063329 RepID=UPI0026E1AFAF|nr:MOSC N-terminal beta barrel domain-containing protein [Flavitalea sp. BT771]MDO6433074.1 MOSC N-terminal beta barrel domain-containing protein [Flavitalea sp. BT771]MDV6221650.1 MOSC N-terminal beta barrel domain-containing protein [Flavitalea sp. BT771]